MLQSQRACHTPTPAILQEPSAPRLFRTACSTCRDFADLHNSSQEETYLPRYGAAAAAAAAAAARGGWPGRPDSGTHKGRRTAGSALCRPVSARSSPGESLLNGSTAAVAETATAATAANVGCLDYNTLRRLVRDRHESNDREQTSEV